jgi:hypothetical protein
MEQIKMEIVNMILSGENSILGQMPQVLVQVDGIFQVMQNGRHLKILLREQLVEHEMDGYVMEVDGKQILLILLIEDLQILLKFLSQAPAVLMVLHSAIVAAVQAFGRVLQVVVMLTSGV